MPLVKELFSKEINGLNIKLFEYDVNDTTNLNKLKDYLIGKVKKSKVHNTLEYDLTYYGSKNLNSDFVKKFNETVKELNTPEKLKSIPHFDVRRERVTEWMAQIILEEKYSCKFYEEADKRMNLKPIDIDKHTSGIDVPGIMFKNNELKFVVCEVKASEDKKIPCSSSKALMKDMQKAIDNDKNRLSREILNYMGEIRNVAMKSDEVSKILNFLAELVVNTENNLNDCISKNIMFFPLLIRKNDKIVIDNNVDDYKNFKVKGIDNTNIENIICCFGRSINEFSNDIYDEALK